MTRVIFYITASEKNPVKEFMESLEVKQERKIARVIKHIRFYGLTTAIPHLKRLVGTSLWEIRILGKNNIRILYVILVKDEILLLHGFVKKSQQTPLKEIQKALDRLAEWNTHSAKIKD